MNIHRGLTIINYDFHFYCLDFPKKPFRSQDQFILDWKYHRRSLSNKFCHDKSLKVVLHLPI